MERTHVILAIGVLAVAGIAGAWFARSPAEPPPVAVARGVPEGDPGRSSEDLITVHVSGEVVVPGLVTLRPGDRVAHAVAGAGGALPSADLSGLNLAQELGDGDRVVVPVGGEPALPAVVSPDDGRVDVNRATAAELEMLPGVGPVLAARIFDYRAAHGPFETIEDLLDVPGIGEGKLAALREAVLLR